MLDEMHEIGQRDRAYRVRAHSWHWPLFRRQFCMSVLPVSPPVVCRPAYVAGRRRLRHAPARCVASEAATEHSEYAGANAVKKARGLLEVDSAQELDTGKQALLRLLATLDRGSAASATDRSAVDDAVAAIEQKGSRTRDKASPSLPDRLAGKWRLAYSSTFAGVSGGSQGFTGPPGAGTPLRLGAVYQRVQPFNKRRLDNIVELRVPGLLPFSGSIPVTACLSHSLEFIGRPDTVRIEFLDITFRVQGVRGLRPITLPSPVQALGLQAILPLQLRGGEFTTTYCDADFRVSRGDRGELRIFTRA
jgi:PAP_fibrillin